jgi:hypothetical protein
LKIRGGNLKKIEPINPAHRGLGGLYMKTCFKKNPLIHSGQTQEQRLKEALLPTYVQVDERKTEDLLIFFKQYAELLNYYNENNIIESDWSKIINSDVVYLLAEASKTNLNAISKTFSELMQGYEKGNTQTKRKRFYATLYDVLYTVFEDINRFYKTIPDSSSIKKEIYFEIEKYLATDFNLMLKAFRFGIDNTIFVANSNSGIKNKDYSYKFLFAGGTLTPTSDDSKINAIFSNVILSQIAVGFDTKFYGIPPLTDKFDQLDYSVVSVKQLFRRVFDAYNRIVQKATASLQIELTQNSAHQGHHGLLLAFIELFKIHQKEINQFTEKHFDFYLKDALKLNPIAGSPDQAHILFEPTANVNGYKIATKTQLKAGKDDLGKDLVYTTNEDLILNQAKINEIKTVFIEQNKKVYALPVANSADGLGKDLEPEKPTWAAFGLYNGLDADKKNIANIGFAVASPVLLLQEGSRKVTMTFSALNIPAGFGNLTEFKNYFRLYLTTSKGWVEVQFDNPTDTFNAIPTSFTLTFNLSAEFPSVIPFDAKMMEGGFATQYPIARFALKQDLDGAYQKFKDLVLTQIKIDVSVQNIKNLTLQNDLGTMDATKPFMPFGAVPKKGSTFYVGNQEAFKKNLTKLVFKLEWLGLPTSIVSHYAYQNNSPSNNTNYLGVTAISNFTVDISFLDKKDWKKAGTALMFPADNNITINNGVIDASDAPVSNAINFFFGGFVLWDVVLVNGQFVWKNTQSTASPSSQPLNADTEKGFAKFELSGPNNAFGHDVYPITMAQQAVKLATNATNYSLPNPPHTPTLKALLLDYDASETIALGATDQLLKGQLFVIHPFGFDEQIVTNPKVLPQFEHQNKEKINEFFESALYLSIQEIELLQTLTILFQIADGTEDIALDPSPVVWSYLSDSGWKELDKNLIGDSTQNLLQSGIVKIILPRDAINSSTLFEAKNYWIRASVKQNSSAHPRLLLVKAQAVRATFLNQQNSPNHLAKALAAGTIAKLVNSDSSVKSISQPFASFGGRMIEDTAHFHQRISERLRHKNRAITIWDYEHLILQRFQQIHKVKCLNHTGFRNLLETDNQTQKDNKYSESLAGSVMVVLIPDIRNRTGGNPYIPKVSRNTLVNIKQYIQGAAATPCQPAQKALNCGFATLFIENPRYERIKITCKIKFIPCIDANFYRIQLDADLKAYLAPWTSDKNRNMNFGGSVHKSVILNFIENLNYVDYITDFGIQQYTEDGLTELNAANPDEAITTTSHSILTTAETHSIDVIS